MRAKFLYILIFIFSVSNAFADVEFTASAPRAVAQGAKFQLIYSLNDKGSDLRVPDIKDFQILMGPSTSQSSSMQIINGNVTREVSYTYTYVLSALDVGKFTIEPATIKVDGKTYKSNSVEIEVVKADQQQSTQQSHNQQLQQDGPPADDIMLRVSANKTSVFVNEPILLTTKIYTRVNLEGVSDFDQPALRDFIVQELENESESIQWSMENIDGKTYNVGTFNRRVIYPQKAGRFELEPTSIEFLIRQRTSRQSNSIFGDFFDSYRTVKQRKQSRKITINVKPLPSPRPADYSGVVGNVTLSVSASTSDAEINDGITIKTVITGTGNHKMAKQPTINYPADFDVFDPEITNRIKETPQGGNGSRIIETLIIPRHSGTFEIPPVSYTIFNPASGKYETLKSKPITLNIARGEGEELSTSDIQGARRNVNREDVKFLGKDIRFIKTNEIKLTPINTFLFGSTTFILGYLIPLILFILIFFLNQKRIKENADISKVKNRRANKVAIRRLKKSSQLLKKDDKEGFYEELSRALWGYVSDKLNIPPSELTKDNVRAILLESGASEEVSDEFLNILDTCEYARYSPQSDHNEREEMYKNTMATISQLENSLKRVRK